MLIELYNILIICITETHLNSEIKNSEIYLNNFNIFRVDRKNGKKCGGSCIFVHKSIHAELIPNFNAPDSLGVTLEIGNSCSKLLCIYRSQNLDALEQNILLSQLANLEIKPSEDVLVFGDYNLPDVNWDTFVLDCNTDTRNNNYILQNHYLDVFSSMGLTSVLENGTITRRRLVGDTLQESHLDQVLSSNEDIVLSAETVSPLGKSDHLGILVEIKSKNNIEYIQMQKQNWAKFPVDQICTFGENINWAYSSNDLSSNDMWGELSSKLDSITENVPKVSLKSTSTGDIVTKLPWDCSALKRKRKEKDFAWSVFESDPLAINLNEALQKQGAYDRKQNESIIKYENKIVGVIKTKPKVFYKYMRSKNKIKESVSALKDEHGKLSKSPKDAANLLANFFATTFTNEPMGPLEEKCYKTCDSFIEDLDITPELVKKHLSKLDQSKSMGPDGIHPKLLANLAPNIEFVQAVTLLFQKNYSSGKMPFQWKTANVTALHKKGSKTDPSHYRPISLTCILCKVYESIIRTHIFNHVRNQITNLQHGFFPARSCLSNLLESLDIINEMLANGEWVDVFYLDFWKAFDSVAHFRLIEKLRSFGICGSILNVISDFLSERTFKVIVGNSYSHDHKVTSGVPQGSVLGPLLFLLFINDLPENILNRVSLFADDLKMYGPSSMGDVLQSDLDKLSSWEMLWLLNFNTTDSKCKVMHVGKNNPCNAYFLHGAELPSIDSEVDLGVLMTKEWTFKPHIDSLVKKANSTSAWILRCVITRSSNVMLKLYTSLLRPHLEYCVQLWSPLPSHGNWGSILSIENVQRNFTRAIEGVGLLTYNDRLKKLGLTTLLERRARGDLIETFRILSGIANYGSTLLKLSHSGRNLVSRPGDQNSFKYSFFSRRVIHYWNKLPHHIKNSESVNQFKNRLDKFRERNLDLPGHYWELSSEIFTRINDTNRNDYVTFMTNNPIVAQLKNISLVT